MPQSQVVHRHAQRSAFTSFPSGPSCSQRERERGKNDCQYSAAYLKTYFGLFHSAQNIHHDNVNAHYSMTFVTFVTRLDNDLPLEGGGRGV